MFAKRIYLALLAVGAMAISSAVAGAQDREPGRGKLEGTWLVTATFTSSKVCDEHGCTAIDSPPPFKVLFTFMPGRADNEGTLIDTNEFQLTPNPVCTPDQGAWERTGDRQFKATHLAFCFDATAGYLPAGTVKVRDTLKLNQTGNELTGKQHVDAFDTAGNLVFVGEVDLSGQRVRAEAP